MIGKAASSSSFAKTIQYVLNEAKKPKVVFGNFAEAIAPKLDVDLVIYRFNQRASLNPRIIKPCYHMKFSPAIGDKLSDSDWTELIDKLLKELELKTNQAIGVIHRDTYYPNSNQVREHLHLIVSKVDYLCHSSSSKLYFDYRRICQILRDFETEKGLTKMYQEHEREVSKHEQLGQSKMLMGELLQEVNPIAKLVETNDEQLNGLDLTSYGITMAASISKIALALIKKAELDEDREMLAEIVKDVKALPSQEQDRLNSKSMSAEIVGEEQKLLTDWSDEEVTPRIIPEFLSQAKKYLEDFSETTSSHQKTEEAVEIDSDIIFEKFKNYLDATNRIINSQTANEYVLSDKQNPQYRLINTDELKLISVSVSGKEVYRAEARVGQWQVDLNKLNNQTLDSIKSLPQTETEVFREYIGRKLAEYLTQHALKNHTQQFSWFSATENRQKVENTVQVSKIDGEKNEISIKDDADREIFRSKIVKNGSLKIITNKISTSRLESFAKHYQREKKNAKATKSNDNRRNSRIKR